MSRDKVIYYWLLSGCLLIFFMVILGGATRLTHSGLSMVDWTLFGSLPPGNADQWAQLFEQYKKYPEYQQVNFDFSVEEFKSIFWWEYIHRMTGRLMGFLFLIPFLYFLFTKKLSKKLSLQLGVLLLLGGFQGLIGWYMVKSGLNKNPDVSHYRLALHLLAAFVTFSYTFWLALTVKFEGIVEPRFPGLKTGLWVLLSVLLLQIVYGAFVAGLNAGLFLNTWPKMGSVWVHEGVTALQPFYRNFIEGMAGVQFVHRYLAYIVVLFVSLIWYFGRKLPLSKLQKNGILTMVGLVILQFALGVLTLLLAVPIALGIAHQLGAFLLLGATVFTLNRFSGGQ